MRDIIRLDTWGCRFVGIKADFDSSATDFFTDPTAVGGLPPDAGQLSDAEVCRRFVTANRETALSDDDRVAIHALLAVEAADKPLGAAVSRVADAIREGQYPAAAAAPILAKCQRER
jgi:hypothetical protein